MSYLRYLRWGAFAIVVTLLVGVAVVTSSGEGRWRATIVLEKATGRLPDIGWSDLAWMLRPGSGVYLERLVDTPNPFEVIENPRRTNADVELGKKLFARHCSSCHGDDARGGAGGPALRNRAFRQGRRPWALFRTITRGIPRTAMIGQPLPREDVWRLVAYLESVLSERSQSSEMRTSIEFDAVTPEQLRGAADDPAEWLMYSGSYAGQRHSALAEISRRTVAQLRVQWARQLPDAQDDLETSPIVRGTTMFVTEPDRVLALDASSGKLLWTFSRELPRVLKLCCGPNNRGVAVLGDRLYVGTLDAHLLALDAKTGRLVWDVAVADRAGGYSITSSPLAFDDLVVTGVAGGEYDTRGFIDAYDAKSGKRRWRFYTVPAREDPASATWERAALRSGGAPTWMTGALDVKLGLLYWGVGNPHPNFFGGNRPGDNLYSNSVVALEASTGKLRWYFQFTPHDVHDWDAAQTPVLFDDNATNPPRRLLALANRNGFYYVLDRLNGQFVRAAPFVRESWAEGLDSAGRPQVRPESVPTRAGVLVYPSVTGGTNWWAAAYDPALRAFFVPALDRGGFFFASADRREDPTGKTLGSNFSMVPGERLVTAVEALDVGTGRLIWRHANAPRFGHGETGGLLSTAGGLLFGSDLETIFALDASSGAELWSFQTGGNIRAAPIAYSVAGKEYIAIAAGRVLLAFSLPHVPE